MPGFRPLDGGLVDIEINSIMKAKYMDPAGMWYRLILHTEEEDILIDLLESIEILRDYVNNISDYILATFHIGLGDYVKDILPYMDNLDATLILRYFDKEYSNKYKFVINNNPGGVVGSPYSSLTRGELNKMDKVEVEGQLVDIATQALRIIDVGGVYSYTTPENVIKNVIKTASKEVAVEGEALDLRINLIPPNNQKRYRHVSLPLGINVFDVPSYIQNTDYGFYHTGLGTYFQPFGLTTDDPVKDTMFIYPLYNRLEYDKPRKKLMILNNPTITYKFIEYTYYVDGDVVKIVCSTNSKNYDIGDNTLIDKGAAFIATDPQEIATGIKKVDDARAENIRDDTVKGYQLKKPTDKAEKAKYLNNTDNLYKHSSVIAKNDMTLYQVEWHFCNHELLYPGMPVGYVYDHDKLGTIVLKGILQSVYVKYSEATKSFSAMLYIMVEKKIDKEG